jgi:hypothetical protein
MHSPLTASTPLPPSAGSINSRHTDTLLYQAMTIAAMLMTLISIWVF